MHGSPGSGAPSALVIGDACEAGQLFVALGKAKAKAWLPVPAPAVRSDRRTGPVAP
jgi:hypothetical protein